MLELIDRAGAVGWGTVLVAIALVILLVRMAIESWNRLLKSLGLVKKKKPSGGPAREGNRGNL